MRRRNSPSDKEVQVAIEQCGELWKKLEDASLKTFGGMIEERQVHDTQVALLGQRLEMAILRAMDVCTEVASELALMNPTAAKKTLKSRALKDSDVRVVVGRTLRTGKSGTAGYLPSQYKQGHLRDKPRPKFTEYLTENPSQRRLLDSRSPDFVAGQQQAERDVRLRGLGVTKEEIARWPNDNSGWAQGYRHYLRSLQARR